MPIERTSSLTEWIRQAIRESGRGAISFHDYMDICLYHPVYGYYTSARPKVGKEGDFYTSANIGGIMGEMIARYFIHLFDDGRREYRIVEWGGGTGLMAKQILDTVKRLAPVIYSRLQYVLIERSAYHRQEQEAFLKEHGVNTVWWSEEEWRTAKRDVPALIFANELMDAFPVHRLRQKNGVLYELHVAWNDSRQGFEDHEIPCGDPELLGYLKQEAAELREGQTVEVNVGAGKWIGENLRRLEEGTLLAIDYGDTAGELYASHRMNGTLVCYRNHQAGDDPYLFPGGQDITAHVNFSACIRAAEDHGADSVKLQTQKAFLLECGVLELLQNHNSTDPFGPEARRNRAIRQLLLSDGMSELFKVLEIRKTRSGPIKKS